MGMEFYNVKKWIPNIEGNILEIGSERGNNSTEVLADIAYRNKVKLYSVDINAALIEKNKSHYSKLFPHFPIEWVVSSGEEFLKNTKEKFSVILLDNFDWTWWPQKNEPWVMEQSKQYSTNWGLEMNNINSQVTHMMQAVYMMPLLTKECWVICDDTFMVFPQETYSGKCGAVIPYLLGQNFNIIYKEANGVLLSRK